MSRSFKIGDLVRIKSGGPMMVVTEVGENQDGKPIVTCTWVDEDKPEVGTFPADTVKPD